MSGAGWVLAKAIVCLGPMSGVPQCAVHTLDEALSAHWEIYATEEACVRGFVADYYMIAKDGAPDMGVLFSRVTCRPLPST